MQKQTYVDSISVIVNCFLDKEKNVKNIETYVPATLSSLQKKRTTEIYEISNDLIGLLSGANTKLSLFLYFMKRPCDT